MIVFAIMFLFYRLFDKSGKLGNVDTFLLHSVAVADGNGVVVEGVKIDSNTHRRTYLVLRVISLADVPPVIPDNRAFAVPFYFLVNFTRFLHQDDHIS